MQKNIANAVEFTTDALYIANMEMDMNYDGLVVPEGFVQNFLKFHEEHPWETITAVHTCQLKVKALGVPYDEQFFKNWVPFYDVCPIVTCMREMTLTCPLKSHAYTIFNNLAYEAERLDVVPFGNRQIDFLAEKRINGYGPCDDICTLFFVLFNF